MARITILAFVVLLGMPPLASAAPPPTVTHAADGIFDAFSSHPLVGLGDWHGMAQELDFYATLIRDPRFAADVGNLVLEFGTAAQQDTIDRYVNGENVPYTQLRKAWADEVNADPTNPFIGFMNVFETVRSVNMKLPPAGRIKVWLSDPPIDWSKITTHAEYEPFVAQRESYPAELIDREILGKGKKALVIYGTNHLSDFSALHTTRFGDPNNLRARVESAHPGAFFFIEPYVGYVTKDCTAAFEKHIKDWPVPALVTPIRGSSLEADILRPGCGSYPILPDMSQVEYTTIMGNYAGLTSDALLYLGPRNQMLMGPSNPDIYLDLDFRAELERRHQIRNGAPLEGWDAGENPSVPKPYWPVPGFEDTEFGVFMEPGGVSWRDGSLRESSSLRL